MQYERGEVRSKVDFDIAGPLPSAEHRHRHGPGADGRRPAGRRQPLRDRHQPRDPRPRRRADRRAVRRRPRGRRLAAGRRRPRPHRRDAHRRRRDAAQRGPRLRAAPDHAPRHPLDAPARRAGPDGRRAGRGGHRGDGPAVPRARRGRRAHPARSRWRRRARSSRRCAPARRCSTRAVPAARAAGGVLSGDRAFTLHDTYGFPIDLTLEMAAEQGLQVDEDGLPRAHAGAAQPGQGRQPGAEDRRRRHVGLPRAARRGRRHDLHRLRARCAPRRCCAACSSTARSAQAARRGRQRRGRPRPHARSTPRRGGQLADARPDRARRRHRARGRRRAEGAARPVVHRARVVQRRGAGGRAGRSPRSTSSAAGRSRAPTPPPTWCTRRCATRWARRRPRPAR